jgi:hypothetical protein
MENQGSCTTHNNYDKCKEIFSSHIDMLSNSVDLKLQASDVANTLKLTALETLINIKTKNYEDNAVQAGIALEKRLEIMNKFREAMKDQSVTYIPRNEFVLLHDRVLEDIRILRESKATLEGKASTNSVVGVYIISIIGLLVAALDILLRIYGK